MVSVSSPLGSEHDDNTPSLVCSQLNAEDCQRVQAALHYVEHHTQGLLLDTQEATYPHVLAVGQLLAELNTDANTRIAGILGPMVFFERHLEAKMEPLFGDEVVRMLSSLRKLFKVRSLVGPSSHLCAIESVRWAEQLETLRKMLLAMSSDIRVVMIRLCSRLQTLRFFSSHPDVKQQTGKIWGSAISHARETIDLYATLANRLGLWQLKWELEDLAFRILQPSTYKEVAVLLDAKRTEREAFIQHSIQSIKNTLSEQGIPCEISGRPKHIYSIWNKMRSKNIPFEKLYDISGCRVIVADQSACYKALSIIHNMWQPIEDELDDYISKPKSNGYQSLHTVVMTTCGKALEIQIRTPEMHQFAEYGVAAHWRYKEAGTEGYEGKSRAEGQYEERIALLRQLLAWQKDVTDTMDVNNNWAAKMQTSALNDQIYVFTPQAKVIELPQGSTPLDFAYHVHTELGHRCRGAKINGQLVPLNRPLEHGQTVEIISARKDNNNGPSRDWLAPNSGYLASHRAREKVKRWFAQQDRREQLERGQNVVEKELQRIGQTTQNIEKLAQMMGYEKTEDLFLALAREEIRPRAIEHTLTPNIFPEPNTNEQQIRLSPQQKTNSGNNSGVLIVGVSALMTNLARCCRPAPPDPIIGFVTRGKGVSIHRLGCSNLETVMRNQPERLIEASWGESKGLHYPVDILVSANDRQGLLRDVTEVFSRDKINVIGVQTESLQGIANMSFTVEVTSGEQLKQSLSHLLEVNSVFEARRR